LWDKRRTGLERDVTQGNVCVCQLEANLLVCTFFDLLVVDGPCQVKDLPSSVKVILWFFSVLFFFVFLFFLFLFCSSSSSLSKEINSLFLAVIFKVSGEGEDRSM